VIIACHVGTNGIAPLIANRPSLGPNNSRHLCGDDVPIGMNRNKEASALQRKTDPTTRRRSSSGTAKAKRFAFELK
jgi:hypothetical protein